MPETTQELNVSVKDELTLTPLVGASLVNEIFKSVLYQKCQIPYPYSFLKQVVEKRRKHSIDSQEHVSRKVNFTYENHFKTVSSAYDYLNSVMKCIVNKFAEHGNDVEEVVILFGSSMFSVKEAVTVHIPVMATGHVERNHVNELNKHVQKVLR